MPLFQPYGDFSYADSDEITLPDSFSGELPCYSAENAWYILDPGLESMQQNYHYDNRSIVGNRHQRNSHGFCAAYNPTDHGFSSRSPSSALSVTSQQSHSQTMWGHDMDQNRNFRFMSPTSSATSSYSADLSQRELALMSDTASRTSTIVPFPTFDNLSSLVNQFSGQNIYSHQQIPAPFPPVHILPSQGAYSMKEFQYNPDILADILSDEDALFGEGNNLQETVQEQLSIQLPEELDLIEHHSPTDSGLGPSVVDGDIPGGKSYEDEDNQEADVILDDNDADSDFSPGKAIRRRMTSTTIRSLRSLRRTASNSNSTSSSTIDVNSRITKQSSSKSSVTKSRSKPRTKSHGSHSRGSAVSNSKYFPCTFHHYGCPTVFASKNEWKRHVASQHLQLGFYRCDMDGCTVEPDSGRSHNDFNRKDLFTQHCRRMHAPWGSKDINTVPKREKEAFEKELENIRDRCWSVRRQAPTWAVCGLCNTKFGSHDQEGSKTWEERMEHLGRHYEKDDVKEGMEKVDTGLKQWAIQEGIVRRGTDGGWWLIGFEPTVSSASRGRRNRATARSKRPATTQADTSDEEETEEAQEHDTPAVASEDSSLDAEGEPDSDVDVDMESDTDAEGEDE